ncbi:glycine cleavage system protein GcvH [Actinacidiphila yeochonensis]|uniref:glycine cleavage system protein GcvH n=1 Tax=Actinacidiphila yeochonensis TaxID=89050 RepID=UPI0005658B18|nr:glycine cleavage system protein GcvH [Actinacidiphila yeochonensis]
MTIYPGELRYTREHEWVRVDGDTARVGITEFAQKELGDVVYVELPKVGDRLDHGQEFGTVESVKAVSELYTPLSGEVVTINESLNDDPEQLNDDPHGDGWMVEIRFSAKAELDGLMTADAYEAYIASGEE